MTIADKKFSALMFTLAFAAAGSGPGDAFYNNGEYVRALPLIKSAYRQKADGETAFRLGRCYFEAGMPDSAAAYLKHALDRGHNFHETMLYTARAQYGRRMYGDAAAAYSKVGRELMTAPDYFMLGSSLEKTAGAAGALEAYSAAVQAYGNDRPKEALLSRAYIAQAHLDKKEASAALRHLQFIAKHDGRAAVVNDLYFMLADAHAEAGDNAAAIGSLEKAISLNSKNAEAYARLAELYEKTGRGDRAKRVYGQLLSASQKDPNVFLALGRYNLKTGRWSEAIPHFEKSLGLAKSGAAFEGIAVASFNMGGVKKALEAARAAVALDPRLMDARVVMAKTLIIEKNFKQAQEQAEWICEREPGSLEYLRMLALCCENNGDAAKLAWADRQIAAADRRDTVSRLRLARYAEAKNDAKTAAAMYREVTAIDPGHADSFRRLAALSRREKQPRDAVAYIKKYMELAPDDAGAHRDLGDILYEQKNHAAALAAYGAAMKADPSLKGFHRRYAGIAAAGGQAAEAITALSEAMESGGADAGVYAALGTVYRRNRQFGEAAEMYSRAVELEPSDFEARTALAACLAAGGDTIAAIAAYEQALAMNPGASEEHRALGDLYMKQNKNREALRSYMNCLDKTDRAKTDRTLAANVGRLLYGEKKYAEAAKYLALAGGHDTEALFMLADASLRTNNIKDAESAADDILLKDPENTEARMLRAKILRARKNWDEALDALKEISDANPDMAAPYYERAETYMMAGKPTWAETFYKRTLRADPQFGLAELGLAKMYKAQKRMDLYKKHLEAARRLLPDSELVVEEVKQR